jgi:hypothetical protein
MNKQHILAGKLYLLPLNIHAQNEHEWDTVLLAGSYVAVLAVEYINRLTYGMACQTSPTFVSLYGKPVQGYRLRILTPDGILYSTDIHHSFAAQWKEISQ